MVKIARSRSNQQILANYFTRKIIQYIKNNIQDFRKNNLNQLQLSQQFFIDFNNITKKNNFFYLNISKIVLKLKLVKRSEKKWLSLNGKIRQVLEDGIVSSEVTIDIYIDVDSENFNLQRIRKSIFGTLTHEIGGHANQIINTENFNKYKKYDNQNINSKDIFLKINEFLNYYIQSPAELDAYTRKFLKLYKLNNLSIKKQVRYLFSSNIYQQLHQYIYSTKKNNKNNQYDVLLNKLNKTLQLAKQKQNQFYKNIINHIYYLKNNGFSADLEKMSSIYKIIKVANNENFKFSGLGAFDRINSPDFLEDQEDPYNLDKDNPDKRMMNVGDVGSSNYGNDQYKDTSINGYSNNPDNQNFYDNSSSSTKTRGNEFRQMLETPLDENNYNSGQQSKNMNNSSQNLFDGGGMSRNGIGETEQHPLSSTFITFDRLGNKQPVGPHNMSKKVSFSENLADKYRGRIK